MRNVSFIDNPDWILVSLVDFNKNLPNLPNFLRIPSKRNSELNVIKRDDVIEVFSICMEPPTNPVSGTFYGVEFATHISEKTQDIWFFSKSTTEMGASSTMLKITIYENEPFDGSVSVSYNGIFYSNADAIMLAKNIQEVLRYILDKEYQ